MKVSDSYGYFPAFNFSLALNFLKLLSEPLLTLNN